MNGRKVYFLSLVGLPVFLIGRILALYFIIDPVTGFSYEEYRSIQLLFGGALAVFSLVLLFLALIGQTPKPALRRSPVLAVGAFLLALALLLYTPHLLSSSLSLLILIQLVLCILSALAFCLYGITQITGQSRGAGWMLLPILFWIVRLIAFFIDNTGIANISENVLILISIAASSVFLLFHGKVTAGIALQNNQAKALGFGLPAALLCLVSSLPVYFLSLSGNGGLLHSGEQSTLPELALGIYILLFLGVQCFGKQAAQAD